VPPPAVISAAMTIGLLGYGSEPRLLFESHCEARVGPCGVLTSSAPFLGARSR